MIRGWHMTPLLFIRNSEFREGRRVPECVYMPSDCCVFAIPRRVRFVLSFPGCDLNPALRFLLNLTIYFALPLRTPSRLVLGYNCLFDTPPRLVHTILVWPGQVWVNAGLTRTYLPNARNPNQGNRRSSFMIVMNDWWHVLQAIYTR